MIKGPFSHSSIGTLVERKARFVLLRKMDGNGAEAAREGFSCQMKRLSLRKSMTCDCGLEMACHPKLARRLKVNIWICDPFSRWQRRPTENTTGFLRQSLRKGTDLSTHTQRDLSHIAKFLNDRPPKPSAEKLQPKPLLRTSSSSQQTLHLDFESAC